MGELMRRYWLPAAKSSEVHADGDPVRLMLLGEKLIAFRDTNGKVGILDHRCPHRCASLFFGRNEEGGIRCVYHGWKFDAEGNCLDMANVPPHQDFKHKVHAKAYKTEERNGLIWVYMGEASTAPTLPQFEAVLCPEDELTITFTQRECNWLQALEGDIDTSHLGFLHMGAVAKQQYLDDDYDKSVVANRAPEYEVEDGDYGVGYAAIRPAETEGETYWRVAHFLFPCWTMPPIAKFELNRMVRGWIPMDDTHTMFVGVANKEAFSDRGRNQRNQKTVGAGSGPRYLPNTTDWFGRWRLQEHAGNDYGIDREVQRTGSFTGIDGVPLQDQAVTESMGAITPHTWEHLVNSDNMISKTRQRLVRAARALAKDGTPPPGSETPETFAHVRGGSYTTDDTLSFQEAYARQLAAHVTPPEQPQAAE